MSLSAPKISVVMPVYNSREYLASAVHSVLRQSDDDLELIIVDDGSDSDVARACANFAVADQRVRVVHKSNGGPSSARNMGLDLAQGEFVAFVDADDILHPKMLEKLVRTTELSGAECGRVNTFFRVGSVSTPATSSLVAGVIAAPDGLLGLILRMCEQRETPSVVQHVFRRSAIGPVRFDEKSSLGEDLLFLVDVFGRIGSLSYVDEALYGVRLAEGSLTRSPANTLRNMLGMAQVSALVADRVTNFPGSAPEDASHVASARVRAILKRHIREISSGRISRREYLHLCDEIGRQGYLSSLQLHDPPLPPWVKLPFRWLIAGRSQRVWVVSRIAGVAAHPLIALRSLIRRIKS